MQGNRVSRAPRRLTAVGAMVAAVAANCTRGPLPGGGDAGGAGGAAGMTRDASLSDTATGGNGGSGAGPTGGVGGGTGGFGGGGSGGMGVGGTVPPVDAGPFDGSCEISCFPPGGQYCGRIGTFCGRSVDCPIDCVEEGLVCGGGGVRNLCGAPLDSGICKPKQCEQPGGKYCGVIGVGCGQSLDCGGCPPGMTCGGSGIRNVCGFGPPIDCEPLRCEQPGGKYCGTLGNGCGMSIDCGTCPSGQTCGARGEHICATPCPLCSQIARCEDAGATTVSGAALVTARSDAPPVPGAIVYIPNIAAGAKLPPLPDGPSCDVCPSLHPDNVIAAAITGPDGRFTLRNVPSGTGIPIVVQLGKWRMQSTIDVVPCVDNALPGILHFPGRAIVGDIPLTAIVTGNHDGIECLLYKIGLNSTEFTNPWGEGRIHLYRSNGATIDATTPDASALTGSADAGGGWDRYSQVLLACEGAELPKTNEALRNFTDYVNRGGRVLTTHFGYTWLAHNGSFGDIGTWTPGGASPPAPLAADVFVSSTRRIDFATWLGLTGALSSPTPPQMQIAAPYADLGALITGKGAQLWLSSSSPTTSQAISIPTPITSPAQAQGCGRVTFADFHGSGVPTPDRVFPSTCPLQSALTTEEKALLFLLFDLFSCAASDVIPTPPPAPPPPPDPPPLPPPPPPPPPPTGGP